MVDRLAGYASGPDATVRATAEAWTRVPHSRAVIVVEGVSDQIAVETVARVQGRDLDAEGVVVLPAGGAQAIGRCLRELQRHPGLMIGGLCDAGEERDVQRAIASARMGSPADRAGLATLGFFVCVDDLEDELMRAAGPALIERVVDGEGDRIAFQTMRSQPAWREARFAAQFRRFVGAGATRKSRYAAALVRAIGPAEVPTPLAAVLAHTSP